MIKADTSDLKALAEHVASVGRELRDEIPQALNRVGPQMREKSISMIQENLDDIPLYGDVADAIAEKTASPILPEYAEISDSRRWRYVRWVTQADEKVCPICGPLHGAILRESIALQIEVHGGHIGDGHCRCHLEDISIADELILTADSVLPPAQEEVTNQLLNEWFPKAWSDR